MPFKAFAAVARNVIGDDIEAALRIVLENQKEAHAIANLFPDDGRTEATPLVDRVKDSLAYIADLETQEQQRREGGEKLLEGISWKSVAFSIIGNRWNHRRNIL